MIERLGLRVRAWLFAQHLKNMHAWVNRERR